MWKIIFGLLKDREQALEQIRVECAIQKMLEPKGITKALIQKFWFSDK